MASAGAGQLVPAGGDGFDPLGFGAERDPGAAEPVGLFLQASGVGEDVVAGGNQADRIKVTERLDEAKAILGGIAPSEGLESGAGAGWSGRTTGLESEPRV